VRERYNVTSSFEILVYSKRKIYLIFVNEIDVGLIIQS